MNTSDSELDDQEDKLRDVAKLGLARMRDHRFAFPKIDETRNALGPQDFPHTRQIARLLPLFNNF